MRKNDVLNVWPLGIVKLNVSPMVNDVMSVHVFALVWVATAVNGISFRRFVTDTFVIPVVGVIDDGLCNGMVIPFG